MHRLALPLVLAGLLGWPPVHGGEAVSFRRELAPLLVEHCLACHGPETAEGGYRIDTYNALSKAGDSGQPGLVPGAPKESELFRRLVSDDPGERMPLDVDPLGKSALARFRRWIERGAAFDGPDPSADLRTLAAVKRYPAAPETYPATLPITAIAFNQDGSELVASGYHELTVWDPSRGVLLRRIANVAQRTRAIAFSPAGDELVIGSGKPGLSGEARRLAMTEQSFAEAFASSGDEVIAAAYHPQGNRIAIGAADGIVRVFGTAEGMEELQLTSHSDFVTSLAWNADGSKLASGSQDGTAKVFDARTGEVLVSYSGHESAVASVAFHPKGDELYSGGDDQKVHRWQLNDGKKLAEVALGGSVLAMAIDGDLLCVSATNQTVLLLEVATQKRLHQFGGLSDWPTSIALHHESDRLAIGGFDGTIQLWDTQTGKRLNAFVAIPGFANK